MAAGVGQGRGHPRFVQRVERAVGVGAGTQRDHLRAQFRAGLGGRPGQRAAAHHRDHLPVQQAGAEELGRRRDAHRAGTLSRPDTLAGMTMSVEPKPAELPLPGGQPEATVRLHPLLTGEMGSPPGFLARPHGRFATIRGLGVGRSRKGWLWLPIPAFLVEHPGAGPFLVDTGLHASLAIDPRQNFGALAVRFNRFRMEPEQAVGAQLRARGIDHSQIGLVVMTHLHTNHGFDWRAIDYDAPEVDSFETFGGTVDLFGDGSVRLLATPGHTLGHQSVLLRLRDREALLCGDAAYTRRAIDEDITPLFMHDDHRFFRSLREIRRFVERTPGLEVIPGHDPEVWPTLQPVYE